MRTFKQAFYQLIESYKSLPYLDEHVQIEKGNKLYEVKLEIDERRQYKDKPTHKTVESLIRDMVKEKVDWVAADNPSNDPQLIGFINQKEKEEDNKWYTISLQTAIKEKMYSKDILKEVKKRAASC